MRNKSKFVRVLESLGTFILIAAATYAFLSLCNWSFYLKEWNGFSRFVLAAVGAVSIIGLLDNC